MYIINQHFRKTFDTRTAFRSPVAALIDSHEPDRGGRCCQQVHSVSTGRLGQPVHSLAAGASGQPNDTDPVLSSDRLQPPSGCVANGCRCSSWASRVCLSSQVAHRTYPIQKRRNEPNAICIVTQLSWPLIPAPCERERQGGSAWSGDCLTDRLSRTAFHVPRSR